MFPPRYSIARIAIRNIPSSLLAFCQKCAKSNVSSQYTNSLPTNEGNDVATRITVPKGIPSQNTTTKSSKRTDFHIHNQDLPKYEKSYIQKESKLAKKGRVQKSSKKGKDNTVPVIPVQGEIIYGKFPVFIALRAKKRQIHKLYLKTGILDSLESKGSGGIHNQLMDYAKHEGILIEPVSQDVLHALVSDPIQGLRQHQGICADVSRKRYIDLNPSDIYHLAHDENKPSVWLILESVQDPNNFGAILRTSHYLGVDRVLAHNSCKLSPAVSKVSAGALEVMDVYNCENLTGVLQSCRDAGWQILGTTGMRKPLATAVPLEKVQVNKNTVIIMGNEGVGVSPDTDNLCDQHIVVGRHGTPEEGSRLLLDSLNVSVATGIMLHDLLYKRNNFSS